MAGLSVPSMVFRVVTMGADGNQSGGNGRWEEVLL